MQLEPRKSTQSIRDPNGYSDATTAMDCPTLHLYAQPSDDSFLAAQQDFAASHPWFSVERLSAHSHFPILEAPAETADAIEEFAQRLS